MDLKKSKRLIWILAAVYWVFAIGIYGIAQEQFHYSEQVSPAPESSYVIGQIVDCYDLNSFCAEHLTECQTTNTSETINCYFYCHVSFLLKTFRNDNVNNDDDLHKLVI